MNVKWHPCEWWDEDVSREPIGLPPRAGLYLVTVACGRKNIVEIDELLPKTHRFPWNSPWAREDYGPVIAWAELPEPYRKPK